MKELIVEADVIRDSRNRDGSHGEHCLPRGRGGWLVRPGGPWRVTVMIRTILCSHFGIARRRWHPARLPYVPEMLNSERFVSTVAKIRVSTCVSGCPGAGTVALHDNDMAFPSGWARRRKPCLGLLVTLSGTKPKNIVDMSNGLNGYSQQTRYGRRLS